MARGTRRRPWGVVLGELLRERRLELGKSQADVAQAVGMTAPRLCALEAGRNPVGPRPETVSKLAQELDIPPEDLLPKPQRADVV